MTGGVVQGRIANRIRALRVHHGKLSQSDLGQRIGLTRHTVAAIETGKDSPSLEATFRIAHVFGVSLEEIFQWTPEARA